MKKAPGNMDRNFGLLTFQDLAAALQVSESTVFRLVREGEIVPIKIRGLTRFDVKDVQRFIDAHRSRRA